MANTTVQTNPSSLFDDDDFAPAPQRQAPVEAVSRKPQKKTMHLSSDYVVQRRPWTEEDTVALRERLKAQRGGV